MCIFKFLFFYLSVTFVNDETEKGGEGDRGVSSLYTLSIQPQRLKRERELSRYCIRVEYTTIYIYIYMG